MAKNARAADITFSGDCDQPLQHGGDLAAARRLFPGAPEPFVDLSTGINPQSYPLPDLPQDLYTRLPDSDALATTKSAAAQAYGAATTAHVVIAPGTQSLLPMAAALVPPGRAAVIGPTYPEHARAAALAGHEVVTVADPAAAREARLVIVTNPNNPDGRLFAKEDLIALAVRLQSRRGLLIVDEAFMDIAPPDVSLAGEVDRGDIVVLRSFGKFFGLPGMRLGFALAAPHLAARLAAQLGPWPASGPALAIGAKALADTRWIEKTRQRLAADAARLDAILIAAGLKIIGGTLLFRLAHARAAADLFDHLGRAGIFVRRFADHPSWLRFGLPGAEPEWERLNIALAAGAATR